MGIFKRGRKKKGVSLTDDDGYEDDGTANSNKSGNDQFDWMAEEIAPVTGKKKTKSKSRGKDSEQVMDEWENSKGATGNIDSLGHDYYNDPYAQYNDHNDGDEMSADISYLNDESVARHDDDESKCSTYLEDDGERTAQDLMSPMQVLRKKQAVKDKKKKDLQEKLKSKMLPSVDEARFSSDDDSSVYENDDHSNRDESDDSDSSDDGSGDDDEYESFFAYLDKQQQSEEASSKKKPKKPKKDKKKKKETKKKKEEKKQTEKKSRKASVPPPPTSGGVSEFLELVSPTIQETKSSKPRKALQAELHEITSTPEKGLRKSKRVPKDRGVPTAADLGYEDVSSRGNSDVSNAALRTLRRSSLGMLPSSMNTDFGNQIGGTSRIDQRLEARPARERPRGGASAIPYRRSSLNMRIAMSEQALVSEALNLGSTMDRSDPERGVNRSMSYSRDNSNKSLERGVNRSMSNNRENSNKSLERGVNRSMSYNRDNSNKSLDRSDHSASYVPFSQRKSTGSLDISNHSQSSASRRRGNGNASWDSGGEQMSSKGLLSQQVQEALTELSGTTRSRKSLTKKKKDGSDDERYIRRSSSASSITSDKKKNDKKKSSKDKKRSSLKREKSSSRKSKSKIIQ